MMRQDQRYKNMIYSDANECLSLVIRNTDDFLNILLGNFCFKFRYGICFICKASR